MKQSRGSGIWASDGWTRTRLNSQLWCIYSSFGGSWRSLGRRRGAAEGFIQGQMSAQWDFNLGFFFFFKYCYTAGESFRTFPHQSLEQFTNYCSEHQIQSCFKNGASHWAFFRRVKSQSQEKCSFYSEKLLTPQPYWTCIWQRRDRGD